MGLRFAGALFLVELLDGLSKASLSSK